jgi:plastocyanin
MTGRIRKGGLAALTAGFLLLGAASAWADATIEATDPVLERFSAATYTMGQGESLFFRNASGNEHNVTSVGRGPDGNSLFRSRDSTGGTILVPGAQYLRGGTYHFVCTIHPGMEADLQVDGTKGTPVARPSIAVAIPGQSLRAVRRSGMLKVRVRAATRSDNTSVLATKSGIVLGRKSNIDLSAGSARVLRLPLTRRGRRSLANANTATVRAKAEVPFGRADSAKRTLR